MAVVSFNKREDINSFKEGDNRLNLLKLGIINTDYTNYQRIRLSTGLSILSKFFDTKTQNCSGSYEDYNGKLNIISDTIIKVIESIPEDKREVDYLTAQIKIHVFGKTVKGQVISNESNSASLTNNVKSIINNIPLDIVAYCQTKIDYSKKHNLEKGTRDNLNKFKNWLINFQNENKKELDDKPLNFLTLNTAIIEHYIYWFKQQRKKNGSIYSTNYLDWQITMWQMIINKAEEKDEIKGIQKINWLREAIADVEVEDSDAVYFTFDQLKHLKSLTFSKEEAKELNIKGHSERNANAYKRMRDCVLVNSACGFRIGDYNKKNNTVHIENGKYYFHLSRTNKTKKFNIKIPVFDNDIVDIIEKYNGFPKYGAEQVARRVIKTMCKYAGFNQLIPISRTDITTKELVESVKPFYELVTLSTCRKTFCSNLIREYSVPLTVAMFYSSHTSEKVYRDYIRLRPDEYTEVTQKMEMLTKFFNENQELFIKQHLKAV